MAKPIPEGYNSVSTYLIVKNSADALEFYQKAFGAEGGACMKTPDGRSTLHAEMRIGNSMVMLTDENPQWNMKAPETLGGTASSLHLYVEDADKAYQRAIDAGCEPEAPLMDAFWGDRYGKVKDPYGHSWGIATHVEDVPVEEMEARAKAWFAQMAGGD